MLKFTYLNADNSTGDSQNLEARDEASGAGLNKDTYVKSIHFGNPANGDVTIIHDAQTQPGHASGMGSIAVGEAAWKYTHPTAAAGLPHLPVIDFTSNGATQGLQVNGGSFHTDAENVTVIWERVDD